MICNMQVDLITGIKAYDDPIKLFHKSIISQRNQKSPIQFELGFDHNLIFQDLSDIIHLNAIYF